MYDEWLIIGILVSFAFAELTGISPGGIIVPAYLAMNINAPERIVGTLVVVVATYALMRLLGRWLILYGRRRFVMAVLISFVLSYALKSIPFFVVGYDVIGYLVPGIMAREMDRQGVIKTSVSTVLVVAILMLLQLAVGSV